MRFAINIARLAFNFVKGVVVSGFDTARVIVRDPRAANSGTIRMPYGELDPATASLLGALISLTPGTTMIAQDVENREFLLHLLDLERRDATIAAIQRDFVMPLRALTGKQP
jgi:multicomponent K+:H+ antiporter subunit E/multicomponent Na+:H+ antiporter subunit E